MKFRKGGETQGSKCQFTLRRVRSQVKVSRGETIICRGLQSLLTIAVFMIGEPFVYFDLFNSRTTSCLRGEVQSSNYGIVLHESGKCIIKTIGQNAFCWYRKFHSGVSSKEPAVAVTMAAAATTTTTTTSSTAVGTATTAMAAATTTTKSTQHLRQQRQQQRQQQQQQQRQLRRQQQRRRRQPPQATAATTDDK